ncbi:alpha/beta hydrolase [Terrarubrum flagellatum]|uniref:alpha/beta hydrolase n=1 Tax=Terrirubrum flagellatum TaxID=2895980 RepID=UPI003145071C
MTPYIDPAMQPILDAARAAPPVDYRSMTMADARALFDRNAAPWNVGRPDVQTISDLQISAAPQAIPARLYRPASGVLPVIIFVHGGGWTFGNIETHDGAMRWLAIESGCAVLGVDYRLAPEHPFPAPMDDILAALSFVEKGGLGAEIDASRIALAGDSAGANLALATLLARRDRKEKLPRTAALFYGCYEPLATSESHRAFGDGSYLLSTVNMNWYWGNYLGPNAASPDPTAASSRANLAGLPPLYLNAAGLDPLCDDTLTMSRRLAAAGIKHRFDHFPGVVHGFLRMARELPAARDALRAAGQYLQDALA